MAVTSIELGALDINDGVHYGCGAPMLAALESADPRDMVLLDMSNRGPWFVRYQPRQRELPLIVFLLARTYAERKADWEALRAVLETQALVTLEWVQDSVTKQLQVGATEAPGPDVWFHRVSGKLIAPIPTPTTV